jgi:hypothetical protein
MPDSSQISVATGTIQSLTVSNLVAGSAVVQQLTASNAGAQQLSIAHAFILTPQLVQATGSNSQAGAAPISAPSVVVVTVSASSRGIRLPAATAGLTEMIANAGAHGVQVFPASGDRIGADATNASTSLAAGKGGIFFAQDATTWRVILGA